MIQLPNGCTCSTPKISPKNWNGKGASITKDWFIQYRFYDPASQKYPKGKLCIVKTGVNYLKSLQERRGAISILLKEEIRLLVEEGYNPISGRTNPCNIIDTPGIETSMPFIKALKKVKDEMDVTDNCRLDLKSVIKYTELAAVQLKLASLPVSEIRRRHIKILLAQMAKTKTTWTDNTYNYYRSHLMMLFAELMEYEAIEANPVSGLKKNTIIKKRRQTLTPEESVLIDEYTAAKFPRMNLIIHIFFHSGARTTELFRVRGCDVNIKKQTVKYTILKGANPREVERPIKDIALPLWETALQGCGPEDYVFGKGLLPSAVAISSKQMTRRWKLHIKGKDKIKEGVTIIADWYALKHLNTTKTSEALGAADAAKQNEQNEALVVDIYDTNFKSRQNERLRKLGHKFGD